MTTAHDVIAALNQRRTLKTGGNEQAGQWPPGWQRWFDGLERIDTDAARARAQRHVDVLLQRGESVFTKIAGMGVPFFRRLHLSRPFDPRDDRPLRVGTTVVDIVLHIVLIALLVWLLYLNFNAITPAEEDDGGVVQVEFIGRGNAVEGGGALANAGAASAPATAAQQQQASAASAAAAASAAPNHPRPTLEPATPPPMAALATDTQPQLVKPAALRPTETTAAQQLQVSNVPQPQPDSFQLPPPRERTVVMPAVTLHEPQLQQHVEAIATIEAPRVTTRTPVQKQAQLRVPEVREQVRAIEVFDGRHSAVSQIRSNPADGIGQSDIQVPQLRGTVGEIPMPKGNGTGRSGAVGQGTVAGGTAAGTGSGGNAAAATGSGQAQAGQGAGDRAAATGGRGLASKGAGAGPGLKAAPGGWPGAGKTDDWGASNRNAAGTGQGTGNAGSGAGRNGDGHGGDGKSGMFNDDGSVRLADQWSRNHGVDLDRSGTWLKRRGLEYRGTRFDQYWIPQGNLLQEWVRKGVKELSIPIPGTNLKLKCVISLLQLGGGCLPVNPDANEQPATGRKAPDIPFKPELQEDNGSVRPPHKQAAGQP